MTSTLKLSFLVQFVSLEALFQHKCIIIVIIPDTQAASTKSRLYTISFFACEAFLLRRIRAFGVKLDNSVSSCATECGSVTLSIQTDVDLWIMLEGILMLRILWVKDLKRALKISFWKVLCSSILFQHPEIYEE